jgi:Yip1-like protein
MSPLSSLADLVLLPVHPRRALSALDRRRTLLDGVIVLGLSVVVSVVAAEVGALAPYRPASGIGVSFPLGPEADLQNAGIAFQGRFVDPLIVAILTMLIWVVAGLLIHAFATGLGGVGSLHDYLKLVAYVLALWLLLLPLNLVAAILRLAGFDQARDAVGSVFVLLGLCLFAYQIVLAAVAVRVHYRVSTMRALGAMALTLSTATLIAGILLILLLVLVAIFFAHGFGGPCCA